MILRYIVGTIQYEILFTRSKENHLVGYIDYDFAKVLMT